MERIPKGWVDNGLSYTSGFKNGKWQLYQMGRRLVGEYKTSKALKLGYKKIWRAQFSKQVAEAEKKSNNNA